jgi:hypothetical protein
MLTQAVQAPPIETQIAECTLHFTPYKGWPEESMDEEALVILTRHAVPALYGAVDSMVAQRRNVKRATGDDCLRDMKEAFKFQLDRASPEYDCLFAAVRLPDVYSTYRACLLTFVNFVY